MDSIEALFTAPSNLAALAVALFGAFVMQKQIGGRTWLSALAAFLMLVFGWFFLSQIDVANYPWVRTILAILLLLYFAAGIRRFGGSGWTILGTVLFVIGIFALFQTEPLNQLELSRIFESQVLDNARDVWDSIWNRAEPSLP